MQKTIKLNSGYDMPTLGLGTWKSEPNKVGEAVRYALMEAGYKHIDGAADYRNEPEIGAVYQEVFKTIKREDIFITSKLWNTNHDPKYVESACRQTLKDLSLDYLDLYLMHWGVAFKHGVDEKPSDQNGYTLLEPVSIAQTWNAMEQLVEKGLVKSIGVANFDTPMIIDLLACAKIKPAINQIELHPYNSQQHLVDFCQHSGITVTAYSPLGRQGVSGYEVARLLNENTIQAIATKHHKSIPQILINWAIKRGTVVIPKSVTPSRILENISVYDFELDDANMLALNSLNRDLRYVDPSSDWRIPYFK